MENEYPKLVTNDKGFAQYVDEDGSICCGTCGSCVMPNQGQGSDCPSCQHEDFMECKHNHESDFEGDEINYSMGVDFERNPSMGPRPTVPHTIHMPGTHMNSVAARQHLSKVIDKEIKAAMDLVPEGNKLASCFGDRGIVAETVPPCFICGKIWTRAETEKWVYVEPKMLCREHPGVMRYYKQQLDKALPMSTEEYENLSPYAKTSTLCN